MTRLFRERGRSDSGRVGMIELFFDLVFVFAVTQLSHALLRDLSLSGLGHVALLFAAVWWVWIYTSWATNWLDPERLPVRSALLILMFAALMLSVSIPEAFDERGLTFAVAYVVMQVGRTLVFLWTLRGSPPCRGRPSVMRSHRSSPARSRPACSASSLVGNPLRFDALRRRARRTDPATTSP